MTTPNKIDDAIAKRQARITVRLWTKEEGERFEPIAQLFPGVDVRDYVLCDRWIIKPMGEAWNVPLTSLRVDMLGATRDEVFAAIDALYWSDALCIEAANIWDTKPIPAHDLVLLAVPFAIEERGKAKASGTTAPTWAALILDAADLCTTCEKGRTECRCAGDPAVVYE